MAGPCLWRATNSIYQRIPLPETKLGSASWSVHASCTYNRRSHAAAPSVGWPFIVGKFIRNVMDAGKPSTTNTRDSTKRKKVLKLSTNVVKSSAANTDLFSPMNLHWRKTLLMQWIWEILYLAFLNTRDFILEKDLLYAMGMGEPLGKFQPH